MAHTAGPLMARNIQGGGKNPWAVINPRGPHGDEIVAGYLAEDDAKFYAASPSMFEALEAVAVDIAASGRHYQSCAMFDTNKPGECTCGLIRLRNRVRDALAAAKGE
jgi:hypothetical protein